jgi:hypothetical protein
MRALIKAVFGVRSVGGVEDLPTALDHASERGKDAPEDDRAPMERTSESQLEIRLPTTRRATVADLVSRAGIRECLDTGLRSPGGNLGLLLLGLLDERLANRCDQ